MSQIKLFICFLWSFCLILKLIQPIFDHPLWGVFLIQPNNTSQNSHSYWSSNFPFLAKESRFKCLTILTVAFRQLHHGSDASFLLEAQKLLVGARSVGSRILEGLVPYGCFLKWWVSPTTMGFPTKNDLIFGVWNGGTTIVGNPPEATWPLVIHTWIAQAKSNQQIHRNCLHLATIWMVPLFHIPKKTWGAAVTTAMPMFHPWTVGPKSERWCSLELTCQDQRIRIHKTSNESPEWLHLLTEM